MKIILAVDGTPSSERAGELVQSTAWPPGSTIRVVAAVHGAHGWIGLDGGAAVTELMAEVQDSFEHELEQTVARARDALVETGRTVETSVVRGRPSTVILDSATSDGADLIVLGSRGHGTWETMLLGSVSAEVLSHAPCPVLVARTDQVRRLMLATDGSDTARRAEDFLGAHRVFDGATVSVTSVTDVGLPWTAIGQEAMVSDQWIETHERLSEEARGVHRAFAEDAAERLRNAGYDATVHLLEGSPAHAIVEAARDLDLDLVVVGSRGHTGLSRLLIGSVARNVLLNAHCSVLVVRAAD